MRALEKDPSRRFATAAEFAEALTKATPAPAAPPAAKPSTVVEPSQPAANVTARRAHSDTLVVSGQLPPSAGPAESPWGNEPQRSSRGKLLLIGVIAVAAIAVVVGLLLR